nr:nuclear transport factor 2 family protein [Armatimonas sp.]
MTEHSKTINSLYAAFASGDIPTVLAALAPDIRWTEAEGFPYGGTYIGPDAVLQNVFMKLGSEWDGFAAVPHELVAEGETVVALGQYSGTYRATGKSFSAPFVHVWKFKDNGIASFTQHTDTAVVQSALK